MGSVNSVPVVSQVKSAVQAIGGDHEGARETQEDFSRKCIVISQVRSAVEAVKGDRAAAEETQLQFLRNTGNIVDAVPVVGHVKGAVHYALGDKDKGDQSMKSASRTVVVGGVGIAGGILGGPGGAVTGGVAGGAIMDGIITAVDSAVHKTYRPEGAIAGITMLADKNIDKKKKIGIGFDTVTGVAFDGLVGLGAHRLLRITMVYCKPSGFLEKAGVRSFVAVSGEQLLGNLALQSLRSIISHIKKILEETVLKGKGSWRDMVQEFLKRLIKDPNFRVQVKDNIHYFVSFASEICKKDNSLTHVKTVKGETDINSNNPDDLSGEMMFQGIINSKSEPNDLYEISVWYIGENGNSDNLSVYSEGDAIIFGDFILKMDSEFPEVSEKDINVTFVPDDNKTRFVIEKEERDGMWIIKAEFVDNVGNKKEIKVVLRLVNDEEMHAVEKSAEEKHKTFI